MQTARQSRLLALIALLAIPALAAPNFSGTWKLNTSKSDFGPMPAPDSMSQTVTHAEPNLTLAIKQSGQNGDMAFDLKYTTDGKESTNEIMGMSFKSTVKWDGDILVIETKGKFGDNDFTMLDKWKLSDDGKTLTVSRHMASAMGEMDNKLILEKQ